MLRHRASAKNQEPAMSDSRDSGRLIRFFERLQRRVPWHRLPAWPGRLHLLALLRQLWRHNLHSSWAPGTLRRRPAEEPVPDAVRRYRSADGSFNDLEYPDMGRAGTRFGRNVPAVPHRAGAEAMLLQPCPRLVSRRLLRREVFAPAESLNLLAAAWIQFQAHGWFRHGHDTTRHIEIPPPPGDDWHAYSMRVPRTAADPTRCPAGEPLHPTFINEASHWADGGVIYGVGTDQQQRLRTGVGGTLIVENDPLSNHARGRPRPVSTQDAGWLATALLHTLFALEHNSICDRLRDEHPDWPDDRLFGTARLINTALIMRIHTAEWLPAMIAHPALQVGRRVRWSGLLDTLGRRTAPAGRAVAGIGTAYGRHQGVPYQLTEEFAAVCRLHSMIPDHVDICSSADGGLLRELAFRHLATDAAHGVIDDVVRTADVWYSLGRCHPGALTLHNFPAFLQDLAAPDGSRTDLGAVDILRDRERCIPRYNACRRLLHMRPAASFDELTANPEWAREIAEVYGGNLESVDLQVGLLAERKPAGLALSDTAFRVFMLMTARQIRSDRFFTDCYTPEYYTRTGLQWVAHNTLRTVLLRHWPELGPALEGVANAFLPWAPLRSTSPTPGQPAYAPLHAQLRTASATGHA
jgi:hypothetical protein